MENSKWTLLAALLPPDYDLQPESEAEAVLKHNSGKSVKLIYNQEDNTYVVEGTTLHFQDTDEEIVYTILVPYLLTLFDGKQRL